VYGSTGSAFFAQTISFFSTNALKLASLFWTNHYCLLATLWYRRMARSEMLRPYRQCSTAQRNPGGLIES
jgi:hypothetical protein